MNFKHLMRKSFIYVIPLVTAQTLTELLQKKFIFNGPDCIMIATTIALFVIIEIYNNDNLSSKWFKLYTSKSAREFYSLIILNIINMIISWVPSLLMSQKTIWIMILRIPALYLENLLFILALSAIIIMLIARYLIPIIEKETGGNKK